MKKSAIFLFACILSLSVFGQKSFDLANFNAVSSDNSADVIIRIGSSQSVSVTGSQSAINNLQMKVERGSLKISSKKDSYKNNDGKVTVNITMTRLTAVASSGSGDYTFEGNFDMETFAIANSGSGGMNTKGSLNCSKMSVANSGSGDMNLAGKSGKLSLANSGSGDVSLVRVKSGDVSAVNSGSGDVEVYCSGKLSAVNTGSGDMQVEGNPEKKSIVNTGSGDISYDK